MTVLVVSEENVATRGQGKPDYSSEIAAGEVRPGTTLKVNQTYQLAMLTLSAALSPYPWIQGVLAPAATDVLINANTGEDLPLVIPKGYTMQPIQISHSFNVAFRCDFYLDTFLLAHFITGMANNPITEMPIIGVGSNMLDPTGAAAHLVTFDITNLDAGVDMVGSIAIVGILQELGTPPLPTDVDHKCKWCGHVWMCSVFTKTVPCPKCGEILIFIPRKIGGRQ